MNHQRVCLIGAGAVNLISAWYLQARGFELEIVDAGPDPAAGLDGRGATWSGPGVRMFTYTEAGNYNSKSSEDTARRFVFRKPLSDMGWDLRRVRFGEQRWIRAHESLPPDAAVRFDRDISGINLECAVEWKDFRRTSPELFAEVQVRDGIVRVYACAEQAGQELERHRNLGSLVKNYAPIETLLDDEPGFEQAIATGAVEGAFKTEGFTLDSRRFLMLLIEQLEQGGAHFSWNEAVTAVERGRDDRVREVRTSRRTLTEGHFVLSVGAFGSSIQQGGAAEGLVCGVLGAWAIVPNIDGYSSSMKIARRRSVAMDANVTVLDAGSQCRYGNLVISSGFGFTGLDPANVDPVQLERIHQDIEDTVERFFPAAFARVGGHDGLKRSRSSCVRPWTPTGLGVFDCSSTARGGSFVVTGGNNTGGFSQAPVIARAVVAACEHRFHDLHRLYSVERAHAHEPRSLVGRGARLGVTSTTK